MPVVDYDGDLSHTQISVSGTDQTIQSQSLSFSTLSLSLSVFRQRATNNELILTFSGFSRANGWLRGIPWIIVEVTPSPLDSKIKKKKNSGGEGN